MIDSSSTVESLSNRPPKVTLVDGIEVSGIESIASDARNANPFIEGEMSVSSRPQWVWFVAGLFILPFFVAIASASLAMIDDSGLFTSYTSDQPSFEEDVSFANETYAVRGFYMSSGFDDKFAVHSFWDLTIETDSWVVYISGHERYSDGEQNFDQPTRDDDDGNTWWVSEMHDQEAEFSVYITQEGNEVFVAYPPSSSEPTFANYLWKESGGIMDFGSLALGVWPVSAIGGVVWGFSKNQPAFAYGVMIWGSIVILVTVFIALFMLIF